MPRASLLGIAAIQAAAARLRLFRLLTFLGFSISGSSYPGGFFLRVVGKLGLAV